MADNIQQTPIQPQGNSQTAVDQAEEERKTRELSEKMEGYLKKGALRTGTGVKRVWHDPLLFVRMLDRMIDWSRRVLPKELFNVVARFLTRTGHISLLVGAPVGLVFGVSAGIKNETFSYALYGFGFFLLLLAVQYIAYKLLAGVERLTIESETVMESDAFLRCVALVSAIAGVVFLVSMTVGAIRQHNWVLCLEGIGTMLFCEALALIAIHPSLASTSVIDKAASPGEEAIGMVSFFVKALMRLVPVVFGLVAFTALARMIVATIQLLRDLCRWEDGYQVAYWLIYTSLLPLAAYVGFALYCLLVELLRAILSIREISNESGE